MPPQYSPELRTRHKLPIFLNLSNHYFWTIFIISFLSISLLTISVSLLSSPLFPNSTTAVFDECSSGRVYVYDLPSVFNHDLLLHNCTDLDQWNWQCGISPNHGLGAAAADLRRFLPEHLSKSWFRTNQFSLELIFHRRILQHKCRTLEAESATAFYIPFYAGLAVGKYLFINDTAKRDQPCEEVMRWVQQHKHWKRSNGSDHFTTLGRITWDFRRLTEFGWGAKYLNTPQMQNVSRFIIEKATWDPQDIGVPYPTGFHPMNRKTLKNWQDFARGYNRSSLFTFVGAARPLQPNDFRQLLLSYCWNESVACRAVDCDAAQCAADYSVVLESFLGSEFCLQPKGDSSTRRSVFDCMVAGSVPVFFWNDTAYDQYEWFLPGEAESYSVYIDNEEVRNESSVIEQVLMRYSKEEIRRKREKVIETIPRIIYGGAGRSPNFRDAFDIALDGLLGRIIPTARDTNITSYI